MRAWIACLVVACLAAAPAASDAADHKPAPRPSVLWQQYPLGTERLTGTTPTSPAPVAPAQRLGGRTTPGAGASAPTLWLPIALWAAGLVLLALTGGASLYVRSRRRAHLEESLAEPMAEIVLAREISSELDEQLDATEGKGGTLLEALSVDGEKASDEVKEETAPTDTAR